MKGNHRGKNLRPCEDASVQSDDISNDGRVYDKIRDPPGQKSVYILPCDTNREVYRMTTFRQFPKHVPVDPVLLARSGFVYTGYKDRVKCFSCGVSVHDWTYGDDPTSPQWHHDNCAMARGIDDSNEPIQAFNIKTRSLRTRGHPGGSIDSGYGSSTASCSSNFPNNSINLPKPQQVAAADDMAMRTLENGVGNINVTNNQVPMETCSASHQQPTNQRPEKLNKDIVFATVATSRHLNLLNSLDLWSEEERKKSFADWSTNGVSTSDLAKSGFFFLGNLDRTQCCSCAGVLRNWSPSDVINSEHRRHFPNCKMVLGCEKRNIRVAKRKPVEPPSPDQEEQVYLDAIFELENPVSPHMRNIQSRIETFDRRWPSHRISASKEQIAKAGFFFLGERDRAKCWFCNGGLQNWDENDEPWTEHAKWFPGCAFVLRHKGVEFVRKLFEEFPNINRPPIRSPRDDYKPGVYERAKARIAISPPSDVSNAQVSPLGVRQLMSSELVLSVVRMGFDERSVEAAVAKRLKERKNGFESAEELLDVVLQMGEFEQTGVVEQAAEVQVQQDPTSSKRSSEATTSGERPAKIVKTSPELSAEEMELESLVKSRLCKSCSTREANTMVTPCGHLALCDVCAESARKCKVCSHRIESVIKTFRA